MINDFLFRLVNDADVSFGDIMKPASPITPYTKGRRAVQEALLGGSNNRDRFRAAVALTLMLRHSMLARYEDSVDNRITYDDADLYAELLGGDDVITAPAGVTATYAATETTPSEETWKATVHPSGGLTVVSSLGTEVVNPVFSASAAVSIPLKYGGITMSVIGIPPIGGAITIARNGKFRYSIAAARKRLDLAGEAALLGLLSPDLVALLRNGFVLTSTTRLVAAAIGVAYARA